ncbi:MAG: MBL fold metallo-hydrolase [Gammaproteobacteria bacterium]|nr:MBL fold metallo-hydrolase [Gammaproteobacteria bacterium]
MQKRPHNIKRILALTIGLIGAQIFIPALAHGHGNGEPKLGFKTEKVSGSVYMLSGDGGFTGGNIGLSIGEDGVAMIDNGLPSVIELLKTEIAKTTDKPVDYLINTHVHGDHIGNNAAYGASDTQIVSHDNLRKSLKEKGMAIGGGKNIPAPKAHLPVITFSDQMTIHLNGDAAQIIHFAKAHTDGDAVIKFKEANVIHTGDILFNGMFPYIDTSNGGSYVGVKAALQGIYDMADEETLIIPGHGPIAKKENIASTIAMLEESYNAVKALRDKGMSEQEIIAAKPLEEFSSFHWGFITTEKMIQQLLEAL